MGQIQSIETPLKRAQTLRRLVLFGFLFLTLLMSGLSILAYLQINNATKNERLIDLDNHKTEIYQNMRHVARERIISLQRMLLTQDPFVRDEHWMRHSILAGKFIAARQELYTLQLNYDEALLLEEFSDSLLVSQPVQTALVEYALAQQDEKAMALIESATYAQERSFTYLDKLVNMQKNRSNMLHDSVHKAYDKTVQYLQLIALSTLIFGGLIAFYIQRKVTLTAQAMLSNNRHLEVINYQLAEAQKDSEAAEIAKSNFLANISHEIRTPMNAILSTIGILRKGKLGTLDKTGTEMVEMAYQNTEHLLILINNLLSFSSDDKIDIKFKLQTVDIRTEVNSIIDSLKPFAEKKDLKLSYHIESEITQKIMLDPARLYQLLTNFINNGIKYTQKGRVYINVNLAVIKGDYFIRFDIKDTGIGIPKESQEKIFENFFQVDMTSTREHGGTGIGLAICKQLIDAMSGTVGMTSVVGEGSHFWFMLPYHEASKNLETTANN